MIRYERFSKPIKKQLTPCILGITALFAGVSQVYADPVSLGSASEFAVLSGEPSGAGAVDCTDSMVLGNVGSSGSPELVMTTNCYINGTVVAPVSVQVLSDFSDAYLALAAQPCDVYLTTLAGQTLNPGTYCFDEASTTTAGVLTLNGGPNDTWLFKIGTIGTEVVQ